jgi:sec-independent protein translocase protein TatA
MENLENTGNPYISIFTPSGGKYMGFIGVQELLLILLIVLVLFGAKKVPELAKGLGIGIKEFRKAAKDLDNGKENSSLDDKSSK